MSDQAPAPRGVPGEPCKLITAILQDGGEHLHVSLKKALRGKKAVIRANSTACLSLTVFSLQKAKPGKLPEPTLAHFVEILVPEAEADEIFSFVCDHVGLHELGSGLVFQQPAPFCTPYSLPEGVPDEARARPSAPAA
jgi:hypothetical protein